MLLENTYITAHELYGNVIKARINGEKVKESWQTTGEISDFLADYYTSGQNNSYTLHMVVNELLENAVKYSNALTVIDILAYRKNETVVFAITNELNFKQWKDFRALIDNKNSFLSIRDYIEKLNSNTDFEVFGGLGLLLLMKDDRVALDFTFYNSTESRYMVLIKVSIDLSQ